MPHGVRRRRRAPRLAPLFARAYGQGDETALSRAAGAPPSLLGVTAMAVERSLFQRLANPEQAGLLKLDPDPSAAADSVLAHLNHLFNTRAGSCLTRPDYGMPDLNDLMSAYSAGTHRIAQAIQYQIDNFEPRLKQSAVRFVPDKADPLALTFHIVGYLNLGDDTRRIRFETVMGDDGKMRLRA